MKKFLLIFLVIFAAGVSAIAGNRNGDRKSDSDTTVFDRGLGSMGGGSSTFVPKGVIAAGLTINYTNYSIGNGIDDDGFDMLLSLAQNINANYESFGVSPHISYFVRKNLSVGGRFSYNRTWLSLGNLDIALGDDLSFNVGDYSYFKNNYSLSVFARNFIPFGNNKRFAMFYELRATGSFAQSESYTSGYDETLMLPYKEGTFKDIYKFEIGVYPGFVAFLTNEAAVELSLGMLGFQYQKTKQNKNQVEKSEMENSSANFKVNLLTISFGVSYYIATGKHTRKK